MPPQAPQMPQELAPPRMAYPSQAQHWHGGGGDDDDDDKPLSHRRRNRAPDVGGPAGSLSAPPLRGAPMPSSHLAVASSGGMPARADACPGAVSPARSVPGVAYAPAKVATAAAVKAVSQSPVTAPVDATKLERPAWLEAFRAHLVTVCSDANVRSVMRTITVLASGDGLPHPDGTSPPFERGHRLSILLPTSYFLPPTGTSPPFERGHRLSIDDDLIELKRRAAEWLPSKDDKSKGWKVRRASASNVDDRRCVDGWWGV